MERKVWYARMSRLLNLAALVGLFVAGVAFVAVTRERDKLYAALPPPTSTAPVWHPKTPTPEAQAHEAERRQTIELRARIVADCEMREGCFATVNMLKPTVRCSCLAWERAYE